jgi:outer membrane protein OmpA-like peptidoglycan-associated protein
MAMNQIRKMGPVSTLLISGLLASAAFAQRSTPAGTTDGTAQPPQTLPSSKNPSDSSSYATGKPLAGQSKEGFWGHVNPFARKKWVNRQIDPIKDRDNELDELQAKNANDIKDVDARSQAGISKALTSANVADQHAADARNRADAAQGVATDASNRTNSLNGTVSNLDQYRTVSEASVPFAAGRTELGPKAKAQLDDLAAKLAGEKGYILEIQGYSRGGVQSSEAMADSVARYLVVAHQVPVYRIYRTGLGKASASATNQEVKPLTNGVRVSLMHNSLATMGSTRAGNSSTPSSATPTTGVSNPDANE